MTESSQKFKVPSAVAISKMLLIWTVFMACFYMGVCIECGLVLEAMDKVWMQARQATPS